MEVVDFAVDNSMIYEDMHAGEMINATYYETENSNVGSNVALWVTIGVCAILGIVLGIILGRRSAMK